MIESVSATTGSLGTAALDDAATDAVGLAVTTEAGSGKLSCRSTPKPHESQQSVTLPKIKKRTEKTYEA
eukprot:6204407-Amphidinium_carterae.1